jgi:hypothetical protein
MATTPAGAAPRDEVAGILPQGVTAAYVVLDRRDGDVLAARNAHRQIRSASLVKILIALDYLETRGPDPVIPEADLVRLEPMLRSSDDDAASELWVQEGWEQIVVRVAAKIGLEDTAPPVDVGFWGYTAFSAADVAEVYRYVLEEAHPSHRDFIMGNLHRATDCATDGFDQSFGLPAVLRHRPAFKQGWSGFGATPPRPCTTGTALSSADAEPGVAEEAPEARARALAGETELDLTSAAMHTTGTYGPGDRTVFVLLTLQPTGTPWDTSVATVNAITQHLHRGTRD